MWYNVHLDPSLHPAYPIGTKGFDPLIFKNYTSYVPRYVYPVLEQPIVHQHIHHILLEINFLQWFN